MTAFAGLALATAVRVDNSSGPSMELPIRGLGNYPSERLTTETDWVTQRAYGVFGLPCLGEAP